MTTERNSHGIPCPACGREDLVGLDERRVRCIDVLTRKLVADDFVEDEQLICGACMHTWTDRAAVRLAREIIGRPDGY